ncbi:MAG: Gfo/Idh/MocA family oxidoreductase [Clostridia bacterium]|nr:Gfo/Idh/MocA family oxidoreductase [Clostridia bacterium]
MKKNVAVVGYGGQGGWHANQILASDVVALAGIYDIDPAKLELARSRGIKAYTSLEEILQDESVEIVVVATPNDSHKSISIASMEAGKNVVCEKPVMLTVAELDEVLAVANKTGKLFTVHQNRRWDVDFLAMKSIISEGKLGDVVCVESRVHGSRGIPSDWRGQKEYGGGMIYDWGIHLIDQMVQLLPGETLKKVYCTAQHTTNFEVDDGFKLQLIYESGVTAHIEIGTLNFIAMPRFYLQSMKGSALIQDWRQKAQVVYCKHWNEKEVLPVQTAAGITKTMAPRDEITIDTYEIDIPKSDVHNFYRNVVKAIDGVEPQYVTHRESRLVLSIVEAAFKSVEQGQVIDFEF